MSDTKAMRVGVLGLGRMGLPVARRLAAAGIPVEGFDTDPSVASRAHREGVPLAPSAQDLVRACEVLITVLPGSDEARRAFLHDDELTGYLRPGVLWVDLTSNAPDVSEAIVSIVSTRGALSVAAPMAGGPSAAGNGSLRFFVAGDPVAVAIAQPILLILGGPDAIEFVGTRPSDAHTAKLLSNLLWFGQAVAVTEALLLGKALGLAPGALRNTFARGAGGSVFIDEYLDALLAGDYLENFGIDRCVEELDTLARLAQGHDVPFELSALVGQIHRDALERFGAINGELLAARLLEERAGTTLRA